jgi:peptidoglycan/LPS O-acetylase OafA/YrhL
MSMQRVGYLDGLRGLAAMQVVFNHYALAYAPGWVGPLGFFADGGAAVLLFFLMSGLVLTYSFERTPNAIAGGMARRFVRLGLPLAAAVLFAFILQNTFPGWTAPAAQKAGSAWLASTRVSADWLPAIADLSGMTMLTGYSVTTLFGILVSRVPSILTSSDNPIWSLHIEFWGSALVLGLVWARAHSNRLYISVLCASVVLIGANALILFVVGHLSALLVRMGHSRRWGERSAIGLAALAMLAAGIWLCEDHNVRYYIQNHVPGVWRAVNAASLGNVVRPYLAFDSTMMVGAIMVYIAVLILPLAQRICSTRLLAWLGRMSFPIYLLHWPVMMTVGSMAFLFVSPLGLQVAAVAALLVGLLVTLPLAILFERFVDQPAIALSRVIGRFAVLKGAQQT